MNPKNNSAFKKNNLLSIKSAKLSKNNDSDKGEIKPLNLFVINYIEIGNKALRIDYTSNESNTSTL